MKRLNFPLLIGSVIVLMLALISIYPEAFTRSDPYCIESSKFVMIDGKLNYFTPPIAPCPEYPWGTDVNGRDMKSLIFYGAKLTLSLAFLIAFGRLLIALPLSILAGYKNKFTFWLIKMSNTMFSAFPLLLLVLLITRIQLVDQLFSEKNLIIAYLLILFGWNKFAMLLKEKVEEILSQDFIEGEVAIGKTRLQIAVQNILPHLIPNIVVFFFLEVAAVLLMLSQIGVFSAILGGGFYDSDGFLTLSYEIDWPSLLEASALLISSPKAWVIIFPAAAFSISIIGFNLLGEGFRIEIEKKNSRVIPWLKRLAAFFSMSRFWYEVKNFKVFRKSVYQKITVYGLILVLIFLPSIPSLHPFNANNAYETIKELSSPKYEGRKAGSGSNKAIGEYLASRLSSYGIKPYDGQYLQSFDMESSANIRDAIIKPVNNLSGDIKMDFRKDFDVTTAFSLEGTFSVVGLSFNEATRFSYSIIPENLKKSVILIDIRGMSGPNIGRYLGYINNIICPPAVIYISDWYSNEEVTKRNTSVSRTAQPVLNIAVSSNKGDELLRKLGDEIYIKVISEDYPAPKANNVIGYLEGTDERYEDEVVILGASFDNAGDDLRYKFPAAMEAGGTAVALEAARVLSKASPKRSVIFAFWDGTYSRTKGAKQFIEKYFKDEIKNKKVYYIDLRSFGSDISKKMIIDASNTQPKNTVAQDYIRSLKRNARKSDVKLTYGKVNTPIYFDFVDAGIEMLTIDSYNVDNIVNTQNDIPENINLKKLKKSGQMVVDTIYDIVCGGIGHE